MISRAGLLTVASVLAVTSMACSSSSGGGGTGGAGNMMMPPQGNTNSGPLSAGVLGPDPAPDSTDPAPNATDPAPSATDPAPSATDPAPTATDLPVGLGGVTAPGSTGGGLGGGAADCGTLCRSISQSCPNVSAPQELIDNCTEECHDAMENGCYAEMAVAVACAATAACVAGTYEGIEAACEEAFGAVDCNGGTVQPGPGQGEGGQPNIPGGGGAGCAGLEACCSSLDADLSATCMQAYSGAVNGGDAVCNAILQTYQVSQVCP
jgi:hypothetical protein